ncbi:MAG: DNA polymerase III subunit gamma/tau [Synergistaceae bacterium]|nr:DNA polymerase III subunit gamma/tau [Synergistaceae bacterium]
MSIALYRKYRPQTFGEITGQKSAVEVLTNAITKSYVGHAYLFSGSRGCGKTSAARIFAKALNCRNPKGYEPCGECVNCKAITDGESLDVIEIDGASNNGVENIRGLKENVTLSPFNSKYKIYIIDEVHMLSGGAFNALLKTLEEPPEYVIFIMATTEPQKVPVTIRSRCQHIPFHSIKTEDIFARLKYVCENENVKADDESLWEISRQADGALRDALSLLEQVIAAAGEKEITLSLVESVTGTGSRSAFERWVKTFRTDPSEAYMILKSMFDSGASGLRVFEEIFALIRNLWLVSRWKNIADTLGASEQEKAFLNEEVKNWKSEDLHKILSVTVRILSEARRGTRNDILSGLFMLYLEGEPEKFSQPLMPSSLPVSSHVKQNETVSNPEPVPVLESEIKKDNALKEKILETAHKQNFIIYSALFHADFYDNAGDLTVRMNHAYCFAFMKASRHAASLRSMFKEYRNVIISYGNESIRCPDYEAVIEAPVKPEKKKTEPKNEPAVMPVYVPQEISFETAEPAENEQFQKSGIGKFIGELIRLNAKPEVLMISMNENGNDGENNPEEGENEE